MKLNFENKVVVSKRNLSPYLARKKVVVQCEGARGSGGNDSRSHHLLESCPMLKVENTKLC